ncbi:non-canonical purine NTP pyrophosphatase [Rhodovulum sp. DZ06]|uniref:non-canonical purine NTP pyrophosphatase n=1 Tax=Rhodovulum sp. DZ06 TaxID=3425126 RepID=UPI003D3395A5
MPRILTEPKFVLATHNEGKAEEFRALLAPWGIEIVTAGALGLPVPEETEETFEGNALIKARAAAEATGLPALADDSGIEVAWLGGAPGVHTADWAEKPDGSGRDFYMAMEKVQKLLDDMGAEEPRYANFTACLVLAWPDGHHETVMGRADGTLVWPPRGETGHGYDPVFVPEIAIENGEKTANSAMKTFAEMRPEDKNMISHRADAFGKLIALLPPLPQSGVDA